MSQADFITSSFDFINGDMYEAEWKNDVRHGKGLAKYHTGELFNEVVDVVAKADALARAGGR